ncbi:MAG: hypothetical protein COS88_05665 [Chloroflexi bacterium CG07_land_8_20_14_0_80_51_10]|nr:MAG: hypothetical protein COS88_05665 [Chloroflexi bacterium CG07_land_8_20_14_0_80_51_10]
MLNQIYTVGHSNIEFEELLNLLNGIEAVVDVRSVPFSKYAPHFSMDNLREKLKAVGIEYIFMEDKRVGNVLGGKPKDEDCYKNGETIYERIEGKPWYQKGIAALIELANEKRVAIMCSEEDPHKCHRHHLIAQSLLKAGLVVFHIRGDRTLEKAEREAVQLTLF